MIYPADIIIGDNHIEGEDVLLWLVVVLIVLAIVYIVQRISK